MMPYFKIALKSIQANKSRSIVTILLGIFSTVVLIFSSTLMDGEHEIMLKNAVEVYPGYIQVTHKKFRDTPSFDNLIFDVAKVKKQLETFAQIDTVASRFETSALFSSDSKTVGAMIAGIEPLNERKTSRLEKALYSGRYLESNDTNALYIGIDLAKKLQVSLGDTLSFISTGADYSFCADNVVVKGIFQTGLFEFDANSAFLNKVYFDDVFSSDNFATHIIILPKDPSIAQSLSAKIQSQLDLSLVSESWKEFMEPLVKAMELDSVFGYFTLSIFFIVIFFVIMIYTLLVVFSRVKEIGVLRAIGTTSKQVLLMLVFESTLLCFISVVIGGAIGAYLAYYFNINPIALSSEYEEQFKQYGLMTTALPTDFNLATIFRDITIIFVLGIVSTLYPILKINTYTPSEAMRHV